MEAEARELLRPLGDKDLSLAVTQIKAIAER